MKSKLLLVTTAIIAAVSTQAQWVQIDSGLTNKILHGFAHDGTNAVIATSSGEVLYSSNSALSFTKTQLTNFIPVFAPYYQSPSNVFLGGRGNFFSSSNSGSSFSPAGSVSSFGDMRDVAFATPTAGFAVSEVCRVAKSTDGGLTWTSMGNQCNGNLNELRDIEFPTATVGYAGGQNGQCIKTADGGQTWQTISTGASEIQNIRFFDANTGIVGGDNEMRKTTDGGANWTDLSPALPNGIIAGFAFSSPTKGYALIANKIYKTDDGGQTWTLDFTPPTVNGTLRKVYIAGTYAIAIASQGGIFRTDLGLSEVKDQPQSTTVGVYPNPSKGAVSILHEDIQEGDVLQLFDLSGKLVHHTVLMSRTFDIGSLNSGMYFGKISNPENANSFSFKVFKQ